jgi:hypothetical protein
MLDKDKLMLAFYINVDRIDQSDMPAYLNEVREGLTRNLDNSVISYFIPIEGENSKVDCINPSFIEGDVYKDNKEKLENVVKKLEEFLTNK